jgi:leucyl aminopeptidase
MPDFAYDLLNFMSTQKQPININIDSFIKLVSSEQIESMINAFFSTDAFASNKYSLKTKQQSKPIQHNFLINQKQWSNQIKVAQVLAESETFARTLMATPGNLMHADQFEQEILHKFKNLKNVKISVLHKSDLIKKQMNLLLAVGQASPKCNEPRLIVAEYKSKPNKKKIALIGKGIMFDTGGLNIKPGDHMTAMHLDMTGAAVALSTIYALAKLNVPANLTTLAIATSNDVAPGAYRANDVFKSYSGHTVEILNTDAEGRVALADAIAYAVKDLKADTIATIATLTGAVTVALGNLFTGI